MWIAESSKYVNMYLGAGNVFKCFFIKLQQDFPESACQCLHGCVCERAVRGLSSAASKYNTKSTLIHSVGGGAARCLRRHYSTTLRKRSVLTQP